MDYPYDLGSYPRKVTTTSADAQRWCDRGLNWCFGYHHEEAVACFEKALEADPRMEIAIPPGTTVNSRRAEASLAKTDSRTTRALELLDGGKNEKWNSYRERH